MDEIMTDVNGKTLDYDQEVEYKGNTGVVVEFLEEYVSVEIGGDMVDCKPKELTILHED